ncbi:MAG: hypothetical protein M5U22_18835 [Thermoleophilia bacterium]|nr:hypothetical protein [Thermoleophilia bacterium]
MRGALRIILVLSTVIVLVLGSLAVASASPVVDIQTLMEGSVPDAAVVIYATGVDDSMVYARFTNASAEDLQVEVPLGLRLEPADRGAQTMLTSEDRTLWVSPGGSVLGEDVVGLFVFSAEMDDALPGEGEPYSFGGFATGDLLLTLENIAQRTAQFDANAQIAVWHLTDDLDISENEWAQDLVVRGGDGSAGDGESSGDAGDTSGAAGGGDGDGTSGEAGAGTSGGGDRVGDGDGDRIPTGAAAAAGVVAAVLVAGAAAAAGALSGAGAAAGGGAGSATTSATGGRLEAPAGRRGAARRRRRSCALRPRLRGEHKTRPGD